ncbi:Protein SPT10 [Candida viswanathii]|uniref:Protein SPT10 n=1 Tax=Candida viswanathii TaxID=5486 RepID=A0A367YC53_9ASCO|nr:Protein SPT10 [Candida viswanathii]
MSHEPSCSEAMSDTNGASTTQSPQQETLTDVPTTSGPLIQPYKILLKDGITNAIIYPVYSPAELSSSLLEFLWDEYNMEIEKGETLTFFGPLSFDGFIEHWFTGAVLVGIMIVGDEPDLAADDDGSRQWPSELLGIFNIKQNYPGERAGHICTGEFLVNAGIRGRGIGKTLTDCFLLWCAEIGYLYVVFNLVLETNAAARKLWESLNFQRIGRVDKVAYMGSENESVDGIMYGKTINDDESTCGAAAGSTVESGEVDANNLKFENLRHYLKTGTYPKNADNKEKARLRANKASYYLDHEDRLMVNGREVVTSTSKQLEICHAMHEDNGHLGINRTTTLVSQKYHWIRIKETVAKVLKSCQECKNSSLQSREDYINQANHKRLKLLQPTLDSQQRQQLEAAVAQVKQRLSEGTSYADVARAAFVGDEPDDAGDTIHPEVKTYSKENDSDTLLTSVRTYH